MREATFTTELKKSLIAFGAWAYKIPDSPFGRGSSGARFNQDRPFDLVVGYQGSLIAIECKLMKQPGSFGLRDVRDSQRENLDKVLLAGCPAYVFLNVRMAPGLYSKEPYRRQDKILAFKWAAMREWGEAPLTFPAILRMGGMTKFTLGQGDEAVRLYDVAPFMKLFGDVVADPRAGYHGEAQRRLI